MNPALGESRSIFRPRQQAVPFGKQIHLGILQHLECAQNRSTVDTRADINLAGS